MNINLLYQGNNYNFDIRKDINIKYIHDLASKLISKDISTFELFYKKENLSDLEDSTLLKDLAKDDNNITIIISSKESVDFVINNDKNKKLKKLKDSEQSKNSVNINKLKILLNTPPIISQINSKNKNANIKLNLSKNKKSIKTLEYISENKVFEDIYNSKENEIISLMNDLSQKIKEYDDILYKDYKYKSERTNNEISLYEKNIIDFKNSQIKFLKKLLDYFITSEKDFMSGVLPLTDFYIDLKQYNNPKTIDINNNFNKKKLNKINNKNNSNDKSKKKLNENSYSSNENNIKKLPLLIDNKAKKSKYFLLHNNNTIHSDDINESNSDFEDEQKLLKDKILNSESKDKKSKNIISNYKDILNKDKINKVKKDNNINIISNTNQNLKNKKNIFNKAISLSNTNDNTNISNSTSVQGKNAKTNIIIDNKKRESKDINLLIKSKSNQQSRRLNTFLKDKNNNKNKNINKNKNKINILFEEPKNKLEVISNNNDDNSSNLSKSSSHKRFYKDSNKDLSRIGEERINIYKSDKYNKKESKKYKKIGSNIYDFII